MPEEFRFPVFIATSFLIYAWIIKWVIRETPVPVKKIFLSGLVVVVLGMLIGKYGYAIGLPWWIYYPLPMLMTLIIPPVYFRMVTNQTVKYIILSFLSAPFIHLVFSFFLGWKNYMPFLEIPSLFELFG